MATKWRPASAAPTARATGRKNRLSNVRLERAARLARHDEQRARGSIASAMARICAGSVESSTVSARVTGPAPKQVANTSGPRLEPPMPSSTAWVKSPLRTSAAMRRVRRSAELLVDDVEPAEPLVLVVARPQRGVAGPQPTHLAGAPPILERALESRLQRVGQRDGLAVEPVAEHLRCFFSPRRPETGRRNRRISDAVLGQLGGDLLDRNAAASSAAIACSAARHPRPGSRARGHGRGTRPWSPAAWC